MSGIEVTVGNATAEITPVMQVEHAEGVSLRYNPRDLMDATAGALLAINTPQAVAWAGEIYAITAGEK